MNKLKLNHTPGRFHISGLSRSALMRRNLTPQPSPGESTTTKPLLKTSLSTPRTSVSKIIDKSVITKKKLEFAGRKIIEQSKKEKSSRVPETIEILDESDVSDNESDGYESLSNDELKGLLESRKKELEILQRHKKEKLQLLEYKEKWKIAGNEALDILEGLYKMSRDELIFKMKLDEGVFD